jgi:tripartite-type tricarboxylate transporter receptor subunit TctC
VNKVNALLFRVALVTAAFLVASATVLGQPYPNKPVKIIVPFAPGGGTDFIARFIAQRLTTALGAQVIVENRPGAGGLLGIEQGVKADPDGYTLTLISSSYTVNPALYRLKFDSQSDITPVVQISYGPLLVVTNPKVVANTARELIALATSKPGQMSFASAGQGSMTHMAAELFLNMAGIKMNHIPYRGTGPALTDTIGGQTDIFFSSTANALPHIRSGRLRAIAVTTATRLAGMPDVPTLSESGVPGYDLATWHGLIGPKGLPRSIVDRINADVNNILKIGETAEQLKIDGVSPAGGSPEKFGQQISKEIVVWRKVVNDTGVKAE